MLVTKKMLSKIPSYIELAINLNLPIPKIFTYAFLHHTRYFLAHNKI